MDDQHHHLHLPHLRPPSLKHVRPPSLKRIFRRDSSERFAFENEGASSESEDDEIEFANLESGKEFLGLPNPGAAKKELAKVKKENVAKKYHLGPRGLLAFIAVMLLWLTSYGFALSIVRGSISIPDLNSVVDKVQVAYSASVDQSGRYVSCVKSRERTCKDAYNAAHNDELNRVDILMNLNAAIVDQLFENFTTAEKFYLLTINDLKNEDLSTYRINTGKLECQQVDNLISGDNSAFVAFQHAETLKSTTDTEVLSQANQIDARAEYDRIYMESKSLAFQQWADRAKNGIRDPSVIFSNLNATFGSLQGCMVEGGTCASSPVFEQIVDSYNSSKNEFSSFQTKVAAFRVKADAMIADYKWLIDELGNNNLFIEINKLLTAPVTTPSPTSSESPYDVYNVDSILNLVLTSKTTQYALGTSGNIFESVNQKLYQAQLASVSQTDQAKANTPTNPFPPYNPPEINTGNYTSSWNAYSDSFLPGFSAKTAVVQEETASSKASAGQVSESAGGVRVVSDTEVTVALGDRVDWNFYSYSPQIFEEVQTGIDDMSNLILIFDYIFRVLQTLIIIRKYWNLTKLSTPPGDARIKKVSGKSGPSQLTPQQKLVKLVTNPWLISTLSFIAIGVLLGLFWLAYSPIYTQYVAGCVGIDYQDINDGTANGTTLYKNAYAALFQFASSAGDSSASKAVNSLNTGRDVVCNQLAYNNTVNLANQTEFFNEYAKKYSTVLATASAIRTCIDLPLFQTQKTKPVSNNMQQVPIYGVSQVSLNSDAIYTCENIKSCSDIRAPNDETQSVDSKACPGVSRTDLQSSVHDASCTTENWIHASLFGSFMVMATFVLMNISRLILMSSFVRIS